MDETILEARGVLQRISAVHIGLDIGQIQDPTAICIVEVGQRATNRTFIQNGQTWNYPETTYAVQYMERLDLGVSYVQIVQKIEALIVRLWHWETDKRKKGAISEYEPMLPWDMWVDATGVGLPVTDMLTNLLQANTKTDKVRLHPVKFYHGDVFKRGSLDDGRCDALGKAFLVSRLQVLMQQGQLKAPPKHPEARQMMREMKDYQIKIDENANDKYGAFSTGAHDDLVTALGLAVIEDPGLYGVEIGPNVWGSVY